MYRGERNVAKKTAKADRGFGDPEVDPEPNLDLTGLTESEKSHIRRRP